MNEQMKEIKKETPAVTEASKKCPKNCEFKPIESDDRFCGKCGAKLIERK